MNVGAAAKKSGLTVKTIHYYEEIGLLVAGRADNGYRRYTDKDVQKLIFLNSARNLGFSISDCRQLLSLYEDKNRASADVKAIAQEHIHEIELKIAELNSLRGTLTHLIDRCQGNDRPDCPILDNLAGAKQPGQASTTA